MGEYRVAGRGFGDFAMKQIARQGEWVGFLALKQKRLFLGTWVGGGEGLALGVEGFELAGFEPHGLALGEL